MRFVLSTEQASDSTASSRKGARIAAGAVAAAGSAAILMSGHAAQAQTISPSQTVSHPTSAVAIKPTPVGDYTIKSGDTLSAIAARSGVSLNALVKANGIPATKLLQISQHLIIPTSTPKIGTLSTQGVLPTDLPKDSSRFALRPNFVAAANQYGVPVSLLEAVTWNESGWQNTVVSSVGAIGIGQLTPDTVNYVNSHLVAKPLDPKSSDGNIRISASYLHYLIAQNHGNYRAALADYYQGQASVNKNGMYSDTTHYIATVVALEARYF